MIVRAHLPLHRAVCSFQSHDPLVHEVAAVLVIALLVNYLTVVECLHGTEHVHTAVDEDESEPREGWITWIDARPGCDPAQVPGKQRSNKSLSLIPMSDTGPSEDSLHFTREPKLFTRVLDRQGVAYTNKSLTSSSFHPASEVQDRIFQLLHNIFKSPYYVDCKIKCCEQKALNSCCAIRPGTSLDQLQLLHVRPRKPGSAQ